MSQMCSFRVMPKTAILRVRVDPAKAAGARIVATGRSDFPNQVNNALVFPGIFRGALDNQVSSIHQIVK